MKKLWSGRVRALSLAALVSGLVTASAAQAAGPLLRVERVDASKYPTLRAYVTLVSGTGASVTGLDKETFKVIELKTNEVEPFKVQALSASNYGVAIAVVFQASGVMEPVIDDIKKAVAGYLTGLGDKDQAAVVVYSDKVETLAPFGDRSVAASAVTKLQNPGFERLLWDGVAGALSLFPTPGVPTIKKQDDPKALPQARAIIVFGDGADTGSPGSDLEKVVAEAKKKQIPIFGIGHSQTDGASLENLKDLVQRATGGPFAYVAAETPDEIGKGFGRVASLISNQYVVEWKADDIDSDGKTHPLEIAVQIGGTTLRGAGEVTTPKWTNPVPYIVTLVIVLLLAAIGVVVYIKTRPEPVPVVLCPVCKREQLPEWDICLFCLKVAKATLLGVKGPSKGKKYPLVGKVVQIGKGPENFIKIADPSVSTRHAGIQIDGSKFEVVDMGSSNGTYVNGKKTTRRFLRNGDILTLGQTELKFESTSSDEDLGNYDDPS